MSTASPAFARTPEPPYYAVIFTNQRTPGDQGYGDMADRMVALAAQQPGFLGVESVRDAQGFGITVSYWATLDDIAAWKMNLEHQGAQQAGRAAWYAGFELRVARVERASGMHPVVIDQPAPQVGEASPTTNP
ncbi:MAG: antibiotic biosynthesis monooxygenase [Leptothrix sp. (in: b-proteobacteria)]